MKNIPSVIDGIKFVVNGSIKVSSKDIAEEFKKEHKNVMQSIKNLECSSEFRRLNFQLVSIIESNAIGGEINKSFYNVTRDGFAFLAMGFTGKKAAKFKERYINAFNSMEERIFSEKERIKSDDKARLECKPMTNALKEHRESEEKETKAYHYSNEFNMINRIVLGATKKKWCELHEIDKNERFRDHMPKPMIQAIEELQRLNTSLIEVGLDYQKRKAMLSKLYDKKYAQKCLDEIIKINE